MVGQYVDGRERVLGRGSKMALAGRLLRSCDHDIDQAELELIWRWTR